MDEMSSLFERFLRSCETDEVIFEEGNEGDEMFIIHRGSVRIVKKTTKGEGRALSILGPGEFFGEMELSGRNKELLPSPLVSLLSRPRLSLLPVKGIDTASQSGLLKKLSM